MSGHPKLYTRRVQWRHHLASNAAKCLFVLLLARPAGHGLPKCTDELAREAITQIPALADRVRQHREPKPFQALRATYLAYRGCDDGGPGEAMSDLVACTIAENWPTIPDLFKTMDADPAFRSFVLRHVDATVGLLDLQRILSLSTYSCPRMYRSLCDGLQSAAKGALKPGGGHK